MAQFKCEKCGTSWEVTGNITTKVRGGRIRKFDDKGNPVDACECGEICEQVKTKGMGAGLVLHRLRHGQTSITMTDKKMDMLEAMKASAKSVPATKEGKKAQKAVDKLNTTGFQPIFKLDDEGDQLFGPSCGLPRRARAD